MGLDGGRNPGVGCVGRGVEKVLPDVQPRDWWGGRIKSSSTISAGRVKKRIKMF